MTQAVDVFEMTPTQAGMLFSTLYDPEAGRYVQQYWGVLEGDLDIDAFRAAWDGVIARHDMLRARCHWEELDHPALVILSTAPAGWRVEDWSEATPEAQTGRLAQWRAADRAAGFDMDAAPLTRFALIRLGPRAHVFIWTFHHLLLDGWCGALLVREALALYAGEAPDAPPPSFRSYLDWRAAQDMEASRAYWRDALGDMSEPTSLGVDRPGAPGLIDQRTRLPAELSGAVMKFAAQHGLTLATMMEGAWALTLSRYADQRDVTFGVVCSGRPPDLPQAERMIGLFLHTAPARIRIDEGDSPVSWLRAAQAEGRRREAHGLLSLADIRACSAVTGDAPLFESLLIVESYPESIQLAVSRNGSGLRLTQSGVYERTDFPLTIKVLPGEEVELVITADAARIPADAAERLGAHLMQALRGLMERATLGEVDILTAQEHRAQARLEAGPTPDAPPLTPQRLAEMAAARGGHAAIETMEGEGTSYRELMARADAIAGALRDQGVGPGDLVAVCQDRTTDLVATLLAAWRCGAAYLPLDPIYPPARIAQILQDSGARVVAADATGRAALGECAAQIVAVEECDAETAPAPAPPGADDIAYVLYTSGTTGRPKGVPISHGALANFLASMARAPGLAAGDRMLALTTIAFDIAALELLGPLWVGATVVLARAGAGMDGTALARLIETRAISVMQATPSGWRVLRDSGWAGAPTLRMLCGGEALDSGLARDLLARGAALWNLYGPTETTIWSAALRLEPQMLDRAGAPVGGALDHTVLSLRDSRGRRAPMGAPGELWIGGAGLSPGYLHRPHLTEERFITRDGRRFYRTGDRVRLRGDGLIDCLGRFDDQVKLRGYRIELGEIEMRLERHPDIAQAVAVLRGDGAAARLIAYLRAASPPAAPVLRAHLAETLPAYMIPAQFVTLDAFPLTPNGKIDRKALPEPRSGAPGGGTDEQRGESDQQTALAAAIWAEALGVEEVRPADDFFALGGHSLSALRVISETRRILEVDLELRDLFDAPTLAAFCARIGRGQPAQPAITAHAGPTILSAAQRRQWLLWKLDPSSPAYHLALAVRLDGALDIAALHRALRRMAMRHEPLRTHFPEHRGVPTPRIATHSAPELPVEDLSACPADEQDAALSRLRANEAQAPFALDAAPPWRARLARLGAQRHVLLLTLHHIIADEWSFDVILRELSAGYSGAEDETPPAIGYSDFAHWQAELELDGQRAWWRGRLAGAPCATLLPADHDRPARRDRAAGRAAIRVDPATTRALIRLGRAQGCTLFMTLLAAYALFLIRHSNQDDIVIGAPVASRRLPELQDLVGLFVNTLALRIERGEAGTFAELLGCVRETVLAAQARQDLPFEEVLELVDAPRSESLAPLVQTMFSMPAPPRSGEIAPGLTWRALAGAPGPARFDLSLELSRTPEGLEGGFDYAADMFEAATAERLARRFETLLAGLSESAGLRDAPLLTAQDRARAAPELGAIAEGGPLDWLARHAAARPDAPATASQSYAALRAQVENDAAMPTRDPVVSLLRRIAAGDMAAPAAPDGLLLPCAGGDILWRGAIFGHLAALAGELGGDDVVHVAPQLSDIAALAGLCAALRAGAQLRLDGARGVLRARGRSLRFGALDEAGCDLIGPPELPGALLRAGDAWRAAPGVRALLLDAQGGLTPPGGVGALWLGGAALALGYANAPGATAATLLPNPQMDPQADAAQEGCLIRSGLSARLGADGLLRFCAPAADPPRLGGEARSVRSGPSGGPPRGAAEIALAAIWREVLDQPEIGRDDEFFALGGDSVVAMQVAARAREAGWIVEPIDLFRHPGLAALAAAARPGGEAPVVSPPQEEIDLDALSDLVSFGDA